MAGTEAVDVYLLLDGRVTERLSWHLCEGYLLPDRQGLFSGYEAFIQRDQLDGAPAHCHASSVSALQRQLHGDAD